METSGAPDPGTEPDPGTDETQHEGTQSVDDPAEGAGQPAAPEGAPGDEGAAAEPDPDPGTGDGGDNEEPAGE